jgi:Bacteriophage Mu, GemA protein
MTTVGRNKKRKVDKFEKEKTDKSLTKKKDKSASEKPGKPTKNTADEPTIKTAGKPATEKANKLQERRHKLLALVHIAKKEIPLSDDEYRDVIAYWGVKSSADMSNPELEELVEYFESLGFKKKAMDPRDPGTGVGQIHALQIRVREEAMKLHNGEERLKGLVKKIAKEDDIRSCRNIKKLKQLLKVIHLLQNREKP